MAKKIYGYIKKTKEPLVLNDAAEKEEKLATGEETNVYGGPFVISLGCNLDQLN